MISRPPAGTVFPHATTERGTAKTTSASAATRFIGQTPEKCVPPSVPGRDLRGRIRWLEQEVASDDGRRDDRSAAGEPGPQRRVTLVSKRHVDGARRAVPQVHVGAIRSLAVLRDEHRVRTRREQGAIPARPGDLAVDRHGRRDVRDDDERGGVRAGSACGRAEDDALVTCLLAFVQNERLVDGGKPGGFQVKRVRPGIGSGDRRPVQAREEELAIEGDGHGHQVISGAVLRLEDEGRNGGVDLPKALLAVRPHVARTRGRRAGQLELRAPSPVR